MNRWGEGDMNNGQNQGQWDGNAFYNGQNSNNSQVNGNGQWDGNAFYNHVQTPMQNEQDAIYLSELSESENNVIVTGMVLSGILNRIKSHGKVLSKLLEIASIIFLVYMSYLVSLSLDGMFRYWMKDYEYTSINAQVLSKDTDGVEVRYSLGSNEYVVLDSNYDIVNSSDIEVGDEIEINIFTYEPSMICYDFTNSEKDIVMTDYINSIIGYFTITVVAWLPILAIKSKKQAMNR